MNKSETRAYYEALNAGNRIITIDSNENKEKIIKKLQEKTAYENIGTIHIEVFHNDSSVNSYSLIKSNTQEYDLWLKRQREVEKKSIEDIAEYIFDNLPEPLKSPYDKYIAAKKNNNTFVVKSFSDDTFEMELNPRNVTLEQMNDNILGQFMFSDGRLEYHVINNADITSLETLTNYIKDEKIKLFANTCIRVIPEYVFYAPAGISSKYDSASELSDGGLLRHIENAVQLLLAMTCVDYAKIKFTQHEIDMMIVAVMFSDVLKYGWQEDYHDNDLSRADHPKLAAEFIRSMPNILSSGELNFIANCIESHMGQWTDKGLTSPLPAVDTEYKYMVHLANRIASLKNMSFTNDNKVYVFDSQKVITLNAFIRTTEHDLEVLNNALGMPIDMNVAHELDIFHDEKEINDMWETIIDAKQASEKQLKYIELAKRLAFE